jgi:hypothetical protein
MLLVCIAAALAGCYTVLKHPPADDGSEQTDFSRCSQCHESYYHFSPYEPLYSDVWWDYYALPWWYDEMIVISGDEEVPIRRGIHEMKIMDRGEAGGLSPVGVKRDPPVGGVREKKEGVDAQEGEAETQKSKKREKTAPRSKRGGKRERGDERSDAKEKSETDDEKREGRDETGKDKDRDKKRKQQ